MTGEVARPRCRRLVAVPRGRGAMEKQLCGEGRGEAQPGRPHPLLASKGRAQKVGEVGGPSSAAGGFAAARRTPEDATYMCPLGDFEEAPGAASGWLQALGPNMALLSGAHLKSVLQTDSRSGT